MAIFGPKPWKPLEKCQFFDFLNFQFFQPTKAFFLSRISQNTFSWSILSKKAKVGKMSIFRLFELLVFLAQKGAFSFQNIIESIILVYIAEKKQAGKMAIFGPKPWFNPLGKILIFRLFELLVFIAWQGVLTLQNIIKDIFLVSIA